MLGRRGARRLARGRAQTSTGAAASIRSPLWGFAPAPTLPPMVMRPLREEPAR